MAHLATILDLKRIIKHKPSYVSEEELYNIYNDGYMVVSDINPVHYSYPVRYYDNLIIRYSIKDYAELAEMLKLFLDLFNEDLYIANIPEEKLELFKSLNFNPLYKLNTMIKKNYDIKNNISNCYFVPYSNIYSKAMVDIDNSFFDDIFKLKPHHIIEMAKDPYIKITLCISNNNCIGYSIYKLNATLGFGYIIKIAIDKDYQNKGFGSMLLMDIVNSFRTKGVLPILIDCIDSSTPFFEKNGFIPISSNYLLKYTYKLL
ncbi:GNAT family N-acetyltransferase [Caloramator sp. ALD01]|uniref:GNAT family N-acetyltransferase n=1 Tax=Caloramator sp. ALD01 TaxID=1031288 RepID=UPI000420B7CC|nr:GNAT family N-acetyltransferase [Caloramator sp. ALD01]